MNTREGDNDDRDTVLWLNSVPIELTGDPEHAWLSAFIDLLPPVRVDIEASTISVDATRLVMSAWTALTVTAHIAAGRLGIPVREFLDEVVAARK